jgi:PKD repeat protein
MMRRYLLSAAFLLVAVFESFSQAPSNDVCANAIPITVNGGYIAVNNSNTVTNGPNPSCGGSSAIRDVWYSFVYSGGSVVVETQLGTNTDTRIAVFNACGGTQLACNDDFGGTYRSSISFTCGQLTIGNTYYIQAGGYNSVTGAFTMQVTASGVQGCTDPAASNYSPCASINDGSCVYPVLTSQFSYAPTGTNCLNIQYTSTSSGNITGYSWSFPGGNPSTSTAQNPVVTYPGPGTYSASLTVFDATPAESTSSNNNVTVVTGNIVTVDITPDANPSQTSWSMFDDLNNVIAQGTTNDATFCIPNTCHRFEIYDSGSNGLTGSGNYKIYLNGIEVANGATFTSRDIRYVNCPDGISCDQTIDAELGLNDVPFDNSWFLFTPAENGQFRISTCGLAACDTRIWIYDYCVMANFDNSVEATYTYNDDLCGVQAQSDVFMTGGDTYYVRVGSAGACAGQNYQVLFEYLGPVTGCMDINACNYNPLASAPAQCYYNGDPNCSGLGPDLEVNLQQLYSSLSATTINGTDACLVNEGCLQGLGNRQILRFTTYIANIGTQDYFIGVPNASNPQFIFDPCHNHYHYAGYAEYLLYDQDGNPMPQIGFKNGFCVLDLTCPNGGTAQYSCGNMGISHGCADYYSSSLSCQWVDVTDVPDGSYFLVVRTNWDQSPDKLGHYELRYDNNWAQVCITLTRNAGVLSITKDIASCPVIEDCLGVPFGNTYPDCEGNCPGVVIRGDFNEDGLFTPFDEHLYAEAAMYGATAATPCNDLNNDGEISIADAAYAGTCIHSQQDLGVNPLQYTSCPWDDEFLDVQDNVTIGLTNLNTTEQYFDVYIVNPNNYVYAFQVDFSNVIVSSIENLLPASTWSAHLHYEVDGNTIGVMSNNNSWIPMYSVPTSVLRIHYSSLFGSEICVSNIVDVINDLIHNTLTTYGDCITVTAAVTANFSANQTSICSGQSVNYSDSSTGATSWSWSFPGGTPSSSTLPNPTVTYNSAGTYSVTLTASGPGGSDSEVKSNYITVGSSVNWYPDNDGDGYGTVTGMVSSCNNPGGYATQSGDCNDSNNAVNPGQTETCNNLDDNCNGSTDEGFDMDEDGYSVCDGDCDDNNALAYPGAFEVCNNADENCNGIIDDGYDLDGDGFTVCAGDCNDNNNQIYPGRPEICNGINDDCDGTIDEGFDMDGDGYTTCQNDCNDSNSSINPGATETCNGFDDNCNGTTDEGFDLDGDGFTTCNGDCDDNDENINPEASELCNNADDDCNGTTDDGFDTDNDGYTVCEGDCNDNNASIHPGATEVCNAADDDCDGLVNEGFDLDGDGFTTCNGDCDDNDNSIYPGATEICDGVDQDCDGNTDDGFDNDNDGYTTCEGDCNDNDGDIYPGAEEGCDGMDNNCDAAIDEGFDEDLDGFSICNGDCDDNNGTIHPNAAEACNGVDDNCDSNIDEGFDSDNDGYSTCEGDCDDSSASIYPGATEQCNGIDEDCDELIDENLDADGDGYTACGGDCDDNNSNVNPAANESCNGYDDDCDGTIDEDVDADNDGFTTCSGDCNDNNNLIYPGATETCNGLDDNCNEAVDEGFDMDGDGYTVCEGDCDDNNGDVFPGVEENCNGQDDDCDGAIDNGFDVDGDGFTSCNGDCDDNNAQIHPNASEICNFVDDNCNDNVDEGFDLDGDGFSVCQGDCNDNNVNINPGATESCNLTDDNCNGIVDEGFDLDNDGYTTCAGDCDDNNPTVNPGATETCNNTDDDCDAAIDENAGPMYYMDADNDGFGNPNISVQSCTPVPGHVTNNMDCNDSHSGRYPGAIELCNTVDDDCDGVVDDNCSGLPNDFYENAVTLSLNPYNTCNTVISTLAGATVSSEANSTAITGQDVWFNFVATTPGVRVRLLTSAFNALIELQDAQGNTLDTENLLSNKSNETLNIGDLQVGDTYYVAVRNYNSAQGTGTFYICLTELPAAACASNSGPYTLCSTFKSTNTSAYQYVFNFTSQSTGITYSRTQGSVNCVLNTVTGLPLNDNFDVRIDARYNVSTGSGSNELITVYGESFCTITTSPDVSLFLRDNQTCPSTRSLGSIVRTNTTACGVSSYEWECQVSSLAQAPFYVNTGTSYNLTLSAAMVLLLELYTTLEFVLFTPMAIPVLGALFVVCKSVVQAWPLKTKASLKK